MIIGTALICLQMGVYFEARGESLIGQNLVAETIINRVKSPKYPNDICGVVLQNKQFSFYNNASNKNPLKVKKYSEAWKTAEWVAKNMLNNKIEYGVGCHYHTHKVNPKWNRKMKVALIEGNHIFYKETC